MPNSTTLPTKSTSLSKNGAPSPTEPMPEPGPDWPVAKLAWGMAWELHWIGLGACFALLSLLTVTALFRERNIKSFARKRLFYAVNSLLVVLGLSRALYLFLDPYESTENKVQIPVWVLRLLFGIAFPCLTSAFCLLHIAFLEVTKIQVAPRKIQSVWFVSCIIAFHFGVVLVSETTVAFKADQTELLIVCQSFFIIWGFLNSVSFLYSGTKIILISRNLKKKTQNKVTGSSTSNRSNTTRVAKITLMTSFLGLACCGLQIYSLVGVYGLYLKVVNPKPWPWWIFQTGFRIVELAMGCTLLYSVVQKSTKPRHGKKLFRGCFSRQDKQTSSPPGEAVKRGWTTHF